MESEQNEIFKEYYEYFYDGSNGGGHDETLEDTGGRSKDDSICAILLTKNNERKKLPYVYLLGKRLHPVYDYYERKSYEASLYLWTYRYNFPEIKPYNITSDAGWGCMLRSAQMLLTHALRIHFRSSNWKPATGADDVFVKTILTWFADFPSRNQSIYSLHNMVATGLLNYQVLPGEWFGPCTACYIIRDLVELHQQQETNLFRVHVSSEGTVYKQKVYELMVNDSMKKRKAKIELKYQSKINIEPSHPLDRNSEEEDKIKAEDLEWDASLLLLVPLRLGLGQLKKEYVQRIAKSFSLSQSVGILGGRPRGARWFYGAYSDGSKVRACCPFLYPTSSLSYFYLSLFFESHICIVNLCSFDRS